MISICSVLEFEFCIIFACYLAISMEVKFSVSNIDFDVYKTWFGMVCNSFMHIMGLPRGQRKLVMKRNTNVSVCGESEGASLWGDLDQDQ